MEDLFADAELFEFLAQCAAIDAENRRRAALIALYVVHHHFEQGLFHFAQHQIVQMRGFVAIERFKIALQRLLGLRTQGHALAVHLQIAAVESRRQVSARLRFLFCDHGTVPGIPRFSSYPSAPTQRDIHPCRNVPTAWTTVPAASRFAPTDSAGRLVPDAAENTNSNVYVPLEHRSHLRKRRTGLRGGRA